MNYIVKRTMADAERELLMPPTLQDGFRIVTASEKHYEFLDQMQKHFQGSLGFLYTNAILNHLRDGKVRIILGHADVPYGFCMAQNAYMQNDDVGIVYQLCVVPMKHRKQMGAALIQDFFANAPYGMKLACCWCAQDLPACYFWEAMGFIPLAMRTGSRGKRRIHIFWVRRVREDDVSTPFWYPKRTTGGGIAEDRIILPIPPGADWRDPMPCIVPESAEFEGVALLANGMPDPNVLARKRLLEKRSVTTESPQERADRLREKSLHMRKPPPGSIRIVKGGRAVTVQVQDVPDLKPKKRPRKRAKHEKSLIEASRELRDRYLDELNRHLIPNEGKYNPARRLEDAESCLGEFAKLPQMQGLLKAPQLSANAASCSPQSLPSQEFTDAEQCGTQHFQAVDPQPDRSRSESQDRSKTSQPATGEIIGEGSD